jgi:hypothetical protein
MRSLSVYFFSSSSSMTRSGITRRTLSWVDHLEPLDLVGRFVMQEDVCVHDHDVTLRTRGAALATN